MSADYLKSLLTPYRFKIPSSAEMKVIVDVLESYKKLPCLWDQEHPLYHTREERERAYKILLKKYKTICPDATKDSLKKRLDNMRNAYRREYKKVLAARALGKPEHMPVLWYYQHLTFLDDGSNEQDCNDESSAPACDTPETSIKLEEEEDEFIVTLEDNNRLEGIETIVDCEKPDKSPPRKKLRFTFEDTLDTEVTQSRQDERDNDNPSQHTKSSVTENVSQTFGRTVGLQLQELEPMQRYIAEKLISDVIFYARLRKLSTDTSITNVIIKS